MTMMIFRFAINRISYLQPLKWLTACYWRALGKGERVKNSPRMLTEMRIGCLTIFIYIYMNILLHVIAWGQLLPSGRCSVSQGEAGGHSRLWAAPASAKQVSSLFFHFSGKPNSRTDYLRKKTPGEKYPSIRGKDPTLRSSPSLIYMLCFPSPYYDPFLSEISERLKHMSPALA